MQFSKYILEIWQHFLLFTIFFKSHLAAVFLFLNKKRILIKFK